MNQITCKELAKAVVSLAKECKAGQTVAFAGQNEELLAEVERLGLTPASADTADLCVCFCTDVPEQARARRIPLILVERNGGHKEYLTQLLAGNMALFRQRATTEKELQEQLAQQQYQPCGEADLHGALDGELSTEGFGTAGNAVHKYLDWCKSTLDSCADVTFLVRAFRYEEVSAPETVPAQKHPFLSVLTRTQGTREAGLTEALLCLAAQTDRDFEVLIVGHKLNQRQKELVLRLIDETPAYLRERIRFEPCYGDGRTAPLNHGFACARGDYLAILDDDDLVMDNWVEEFHKAAKQAPGTILHAYPVRQNWTYIPQIWGSGQDLRSTSGYSHQYCRPFNLREQFFFNNCPPLSLAFPTYLYQQLGLRFDPQLNVTEDWDFLMRSCVFSGVQDIAAVTSVYRWWTNGVTSATLHQKKEWDDTYKLLTKRFAKMQMIMPVKSVYGRETQEESRESLRLIPRVNGEFAEENALTAENLEEGALCRYEFNGLPDRTFGGLLRLDPFEKTDVMLLNFTAQITCHNGKKLTFNLDDLMSNGWWIDSCIAFVDAGPQLYFRLPVGCYAKDIEISFGAPAGLAAEPALRIGNAIGCVSTVLKVDCADYHGPVPAHISCYGNHITCVYDLSDFDQLQKLTLLPCKRGSVIIQDMKVTAKTGDDRETPLRMRHNGFHRPNAAIFLHKPVYTVEHPGRMSQLTVDFRIDGEISEGAALSIHDPIRYVCKKVFGE